MKMHWLAQVYKELKMNYTLSGFNNKKKYYG